MGNLIFLELLRPGLLVKDPFMGKRPLYELDFLAMRLATGTTPAKWMITADAGALRNGLTLLYTRRHETLQWGSVDFGEKRSTYVIAPNNRTFCVQAVQRNGYT